MDSQLWSEALVESLRPEQCWSRLGRERLGRIAFACPDGIEVLPVNYIVLRHTIVVSTSSPVIIAAARSGVDATFEVDHHDGTAAWSVVARGRLEVSASIDDVRFRMRSMLPTAKSTDVRLVPAQLTGRLFDQA